MVPPRKFFAKTFPEKDYRIALEETNLKPLLARSSHPSHLLEETNIIMALAATESNHAKYRTIENGKFVHRQGPSFILQNPQEAWKIVF